MKRTEWKSAIKEKRRRKQQEKIAMKKELAKRVNKVDVNKSGAYNTKAEYQPSKKRQSLILFLFLKELRLNHNSFVTFILIISLYFIKLCLTSSQQSNLTLSSM